MFRLAKSAFTRGCQRQTGSPLFFLVRLQAVNLKGKAFSCGEQGSSTLGDATFPPPPHTFIPDDSFPFPFVSRHTGPISDEVNCFNEIMQLAKMHVEMDLESDDE